MQHQYISRRGVWLMTYSRSCGPCRRFVSCCWVVPTLPNNTYAVHGHCSWIYFLQVKRLISTVAKGWQVIYHMCKDTTRCVQKTSVYHTFFFSFHGLLFCSSSTLAYTWPGYVFLYLRFAFVVFCTSFDMICFLFFYCSPSTCFVFQGQ